MPAATGEAVPSTTREIRSLPAHAPGAVDTPFVTKGYDEVVSHGTLWDAHSHPFHELELLRNERGVSRRWSANASGRSPRPRPVDARRDPALRIGDGGDLVPRKLLRLPHDVVDLRHPGHRRDHPPCCASCWNGSANPASPPPPAPRPRRWCSTSSRRRPASCSYRCPPQASCAPSRTRSARIHTAGSPAEVLTEETVRVVFGLGSHVIEDPVSGRPPMLPIGRHHVRERPRPQEPSSAEPYQSEEPVTPGSARK